MEIRGAVHCFFEQSGTFKNEFKKLGYNAYDYDIQNSFGETDYVIDLFQEIENAYNCKPSIYDKIGGGEPDYRIFSVYLLRYFATMLLHSKLRKFKKVYTRKHRNSIRPNRKADKIS